MDNLLIIGREVSTDHSDKEDSYNLALGFSSISENANHIRALSNPASQKDIRGSFDLILEKSKIFFKLFLL
mgnify:CR=1 FL=1